MTRKNVVRGQTGWGVTYSSTRICAQKGSTVEIHCTYKYPSRSDDLHTAVEETFWFTKLQDKEPVDLRTDPQYSGRVQYRCSKNSCTLSITDLRESDSAVYKFRFIINQPGESYTGSSGVTLSVTGLTVHIKNFTPCKFETCKWAELECHSSCSLLGRSSYIWYKNEKIMMETTRYFSDYFYPADSVSCAVKGREGFPSPPVCVYGSSCNRVTYNDRTICAFRGSSVDISCTYNSYGSVTSKFWFSPEHSRRWKSPSQPEDLRKNSLYKDRVQVLETETGRSTLRITDLRESDSAQYRFTFKTKGFEWRSSLPGTTLTVTDPDLQVQVIWSPTGPKLVCLSSCLLPGPSSFVWYKNEEAVVAETSPSYGAYIDPADSYSCAIKGHEAYRSLPVYAPKLPSVLESRPGDIMKDSSLSLTCSSDANPPPQYTWYKKNQTLAKREPQLVFSSIQSSDSGEYYCTAENKLGRMASKYVLINVKYGPQTSNVSVSPSAEVEEGSSVTLTCSSDANPAANYTWYKGNRTLLQGPEGIYHFNSISSEDRGMYYCKSENQHGQIISDPRFLDVQYPPKPPSVSVSPSAEVEEGSSVTLTCSSDANPAANYTWYKEKEESPKASGQNFTITDFRPEHSGNYYCEVQNRRGRHRSTVHLTVAAGAVKAAAGAITAVLLAVILLAVFLWVRRKKSFSQQCRRGERPDNKAQPDMAPVYDTPSATAQRQPAEQQDYLHYASVCFSQTQEDALYSNIRPALSHTQTEEEEEKDGVEYTTVRCVSACSGPGTRHQDGGEDSFALYSTVNKT